MFRTRSSNFGKENLWLIAASFLVIVLSGCGSGSSRNKPPVIEPAPPQPSATTGVWSAPAYGLVADIGETDFTFYQFTSQYCQAWPFTDFTGIDFDTFIASSEVNTDGSILNTTLGGIKNLAISMEKQDTLPQHCLNNLVISSADANYKFDPQQEFEIFWSSFNELYAFFDLEGVDWAQVYEEASLAVTSETTKEELFGQFAEMITPLRDFHVDLRSPELGFEYTSPYRKLTVETIALMDFLEINNIELPFSSEAQYLAFLDYLELQKDSALSVILSEIAEDEELHFNDSQTIFWARLNGNVGYLLLNTMTAAEIGGGETIDANLASLSATIDQVLADLVGVEGVIIDLRYNEGGDEFVSQYIAGRMTNQSFDAYSKQARLGAIRTPLQSVVIEPLGDSQFSGPVAVLTSMSTGSSAENLTMAMRERMNTVIIGEATAGGFSDQLVRILPSGTVFTLSNEIYVSVRGEEFEGVGVPVDIERAFFTLEQREAEQDLGLEAAIEWLLNF